jgi:uncharacterized membrane protein
MAKNRLEAFSDGVMAIIITIMVLELRPPAGTDLASLEPLIPVFLSYLVSFAYLAIYWNNHHHMLHACRRVNGSILWANIHLLFWLSLFPFVTAWVGEKPGATAPSALYGVVLLLAAIAYFLLSKTIIAVEGKGSLLAQAVGKDIKGRVSLLLYVIAIGASFFLPPLAHAVYVAVAVIWFVPDRRIERTLEAVESARSAS